MNEQSKAEIEEQLRSAQADGLISTENEVRTIRVTLTVVFERLNEVERAHMRYISTTVATMIDELLCEGVSPKSVLAAIAQTAGRLTAETDAAGVALFNEVEDSQYDATKAHLEGRAIRTKGTN